MFILLCRQDMWKQMTKHTYVIRLLLAVGLLRCKSISWNWLVTLSYKLTSVLIHIYHAANSTQCQPVPLIEEESNSSGTLDRQT